MACKKKWEGLQEASKKIQEKLFESLLETALKQSGTTAGIEAMKLLVQFMRLDDSIDTDQPILNVNFVPIESSDSDGVKEKICPVNPENKPGSPPENKPGSPSEKSSQ